MAAITVLDIGALETVSSLNGADSLKIEGLANGDSLSATVAGAGDINDDGSDNLIVGASGADGLGHNNSGVVYVIFGNTAGFGATVDLSTLDGADGFEIKGLAATTFSGRTIAAIGDVNGDSVGHTSSAVLPALISCISSSVFHYFGAQTKEAFTV